MFVKVGTTCYGHALLGGSARWCTLCFPLHCTVPNLTHRNWTIRIPGARTSHHTHCYIGARRATHCATGLIIGLLDTTSLEEGGEAMQTVREWSRRGCWNYQRENPMSKAHASSFGGCLITQEVLITLPILLLAALFNILQELNWMLFYVLNFLFKLGQCPVIADTDSHLILLRGFERIHVEKWLPSVRVRNIQNLSMFLEDASRLQSSWNMYTWAEQKISRQNSPIPYPRHNLAQLSGVVHPRTDGVFPIICTICCWLQQNEIVKNTLSFTYSRQHIHFWRRLTLQFCHA